MLNKTDGKANNFEGLIGGVKSFFFVFKCFRSLTSLKIMEEANCYQTHMNNITIYYYKSSFLLAIILQFLCKISSKVMQALW